MGDEWYNHPMKIYLKDQNKRKIVYDILNIFYDDREMIFADDGNLIILDDEIKFCGHTYFYEDNYQLKATLYNILVRETGYKSPWGMLTGSKPSKLLQKQSPDQIKEKYFVSDEKIDLLIDVQNEQNKLEFDKDNFNLYINIPFCPTRCEYCSYPTIIGPNHDKSEYISYLIKEIKEINLPQNLDTIYIGGGTPSYISHEDLKKLLIAINSKFTYKEFTFEAGREDTLDKEKLEILKVNGVDRISLNPQTFNEKIIKSVGRLQNMDHFLKMYNLAYDLGFIINMDFIVGLVGETSKDFIKNFDILEKLSPANITFHALATKAGSKYKEKNKKGSIDDALAISEAIKTFTKGNSYKPYYLYRQKNIISNLENIGYQKGNTAQRYNIIINEEIENVIGLGMNANSKLMNGKKYRNDRNLRDYYEHINESIEAKNKLINEYNK